MIALLPNHSRSAQYVKQMSKGGLLVHKLIRKPFQKLKVVASSCKRFQKSSIQGIELS
jgi:hypothetical protein